MKLFYLPLAQIELDEAFLWYEEQAIGLGYEFVNEINNSINFILSYPQSFEEIQPEIRRCLVNRFPFSIIYGIDDKKIVIIAIAHTRRKPNCWHKRKESL